MALEPRRGWIGERPGASRIGGTPDLPESGIWPIDNLFGYADEIQGDMESECQLIFHGLYCGDVTGYQDPRVAELLADASQWQLLLQIDSADVTGMMCGEGGGLYYWIRNSDLVALKLRIPD